MGRGTNGGGSRGGGFSGGSRGGSYRSSGGGGRSSGRNTNSNTRRMIYTPMTYIRTGGHWRAGVSRLSSIVFLVVFIMIVGVVAATSMGGSITQSTIERTPLEKQYVDQISTYIRDDIGWMRSESKISAGLRYFYDKTGVQPYLILTEEINGDYSPSGEEVYTYACDMYDALFEDEGHMVFVFQCKDEDTKYNMAACTGAQAKTVIDQEALEILYDYIDAYFYSDRDEDLLFSDAFQSAADRIMKVTPNYAAVIVIVCVLAIALAFIVVIINKVNARRREEAEETERILNTRIDRIDGDEE